MINSTCAFETQKPHCIVIIFAGGTGSRMGTRDVPKQFMGIAGKPLLVYTLELFQKHTEVDDIYVATLKTHIEHVNELVSTFGLTKVRKVVLGGDTAHASIICALRAAVEDDQPDDAVALIHDGVRPIVPMTLISRNIRETVATGSSITCIPAYETVCRSEDGALADEVLDRNHMYILQAPQCFRLGHVWRINKRAIADRRVGTFVDMANMMNKYGERVNLTPGIRGNVKITVRQDFEYFGYLVSTAKYTDIVGMQL
ncbi:MAG: IspD/TarI family cytidylyltransferase [Gammaproteobacteria bacterium]